MIHKENTSIYKAEEGCLIIRKEDGFLMGDCIDLGSADCIENYEDKKFSKELLDAYYTSIKNNNREADRDYINPLKIVTEE